MSDYKIIDNFLTEEDWSKIYSTSTRGDGIGYYINNSVATLKDHNPYHFYFTHFFYEHYNIQSNHFRIIEPIIKKINPVSLIRIKSNLYPRTEKIDVHQPHTDYNFHHKAALYMVNDNDGFTTMENGDKIESIANRMVFFNPQTLHSSSTCTNKKYRITINFNYF